MTQQDLTLVKQLLEQMKSFQDTHESILVERNTTTSDMLRMIQGLAINFDKLHEEVKENTKITKELSEKIVPVDKAVKWLTVTGDGARYLVGYVTPFMIIGSVIWGAYMFGLDFIKKIIRL